MIIGITGAFGSGKSTAASFFVSQKFTQVALSSFLEEEAKKRGVKKITRTILQDIGNEWREKFGKEILAKKALEYIRSHEIQKAVIDGIRNVGEIEFLREEDDFILLGVLANRKTRFSRLSRVKRRESLTWSLFETLDYRDLGIKEKDTGLQVGLCIAVADIFITNNKTKSVLFDTLQATLKQL